MAMSRRTQGRLLRKKRIREKLTGHGSDAPRLSVFRSGKHIYAQIIDDLERKTVVAASTRSKELKGAVKKPAGVEAAKLVGALIARKAKEKAIVKVCFDRGGYLYHGRVKALADAARLEGLKF